jgi:multidrug efflux system membrane fusion protein
VAVRKVVAGQAHEGLRVITKGLDSGAQVIVDGLQAIRPGLSVKTVPAELTRRDAGGATVTKAEAVAPPRL